MAPVLPTLHKSRKLSVRFDVNEFQMTWESYEAHQGKTVLLDRGKLRRLISTSLEQRIETFSYLSKDKWFVNFPSVEEAGKAKNARAVFRT